MTSNPLPTPAAVPAATGRGSAYDSMRSPFSSLRWLAAGRSWPLLAGVSALWLDLPLAVWLRGHVSADVDTSFAWIGYLGDSGKYIVVGLAFYIVGLLGAARGWPHPLRMRYESMTRGSLLLLSTMAVGGLVVLVLKRGVARARPELYFEQGIYGMGETFSRAQLFIPFRPATPMRRFPWPWCWASWRRAGAGRSCRWPRWSPSAAWSTWTTTCPM